VTWADVVHLWYVQATCVATVPEPGFRNFCPPERAVLAFILVLLAFGAIVMVYALDDIIKFRRELKREERLRRLLVHQEEGDGDDQR
jgi:hypothetical protein